jgi:hypothetical protein
LSSNSLLSIRLTYNSPFSVWILVRKPREEVPYWTKISECLSLQNMDALKKFDRKLTDPIFWQQMVKKHDRNKNLYSFYQFYYFIDVAHQSKWRLCQYKS